MKEFVSSDTNVWFDFVEVKQLAWPFKLRYLYLISRKALTTEMVDIGSTLKDFGIEEVELGRDEWDWLVKNAKKYNRLSSCDLAALAIAKIREIPILTGDGALRKAATFGGRLNCSTNCWRKSWLERGSVAKRLSNLEIAGQDDCRPTNWTSESKNADVKRRHNSFNTSV